MPATAPARTTPDEQRSQQTKPPRLAPRRFVLRPRELSRPRARSRRHTYDIPFHPPLDAHLQKQAVAETWGLSREAGEDPPAQPLGGLHHQHTSTAIRWHLIGRAGALDRTCPRYLIGLAGVVVAGRRRLPDLPPLVRRREW